MHERPANQMLLDLARACKELERPARAAAAYTHALALAPDHPRAHFKLAMVLRQLRREAEAVEHFRWGGAGCTRRATRRSRLGHAPLAWPQFYVCSFAGRRCPQGGAALGCRPGMIEARRSIKLYECCVVKRIAQAPPGE